VVNFNNINLNERIYFVCGSNLLYLGYRWIIGWISAMSHNISFMTIFGDPLLKRYCRQIIIYEVMNVVT